MQKTEVLDEEIVDKYLEKRDIDGLYKLILESGSGWVYLNNMLEIWSLEKARENRNIFWDVCSAKLPCKENIEDLLQRADRLIEKVEQTIQYRLNTVTNVEKIGSTYFMVDCWHDRVLYAERLGDIEEWNILDRNLYHPHSICEGKGIYAIENTENGSVCFYIRNNTFPKVGEIEAGKRPHRLIYDKVRDIFWMMAGESQEIYGIRVVNNSIMLCFRQKIEELYSAYVRSIRMIDYKFYIVSGPGYILQLTFEDDKFVVEKKYQVPGEYCGMILCLWRDISGLPSIRTMKIR